MITSIIIVAVFFSSQFFSYNLSTSSDRSSTGYSSPGKRQHQPIMGTTGIGVTSQVLSLSSVRRGDLRRQSQIIADESSAYTTSGVAAKKSGTFLLFYISFAGNMEMRIIQNMKN